VNSPAYSKPHEQLACGQNAACPCRIAAHWLDGQAAISHRTLQRSGYPDYVFAFHDREELGPRMLARIAKYTGLTPEDL
jgi:hypothetical protein